MSLPAIGQGALGVECREADAETRAILAPLHDEATATCVAAERGVMIALEGDCKTPIGAFAERTETGGAARLRLRAFFADPDGTNLRRAEKTIAWPSETDAAAFGRELGATLKAKIAPP